MAKKKTKKPERKPGKPKSSRVSEVFEQVREPFSLLGTLRQEGAANAMAFLSLASGATRNLKPQLRELISGLGFAMRSDLERLESRIEELELQLSEQEFEQARGSDEE